MSSIQNIAKQAKKASLALAQTSEQTRNDILTALQTAIHENHSKIQEANEQDQKVAQEMLQEGKITQPLVKRLLLTKEKIEQLSVYLAQVAALPDPLHQKQMGMRLSDQLELKRISYPIGVVAVIFESRPEVVVQVSALTLKSGNAVILKGGSEAAHTNRALFTIMDKVLTELGYAGAVNLIETRSDVNDMLKEHQFIDLIIPRGRQ